MVNYRVQTVLHTADSVAANYCTNTLYFSAVDSSDIGDIETALQTFYGSVKPYLSTLLSTGTHEFKWYDLEDPEPRAPVDETTWSFASGLSGTPLPPEVAITLSYQAAKISGQPQARRRGRIFLGPFSTAVVGTSGRVDSSVVTAISNAGSTLLLASNAATDWTWGQYSTFSTGLASVANGWVDNEFDTQRRRGRPATTRDPF